MNIFLSSPCPRECAQALDDKRVSKMLVETAQLLSTSLRLQGVEDEVIYKSTHTAHPCSKWAGRSRANFHWLVEHGFELAKEYEFRTDHRRHHASEYIVQRCLELSDAIPKGDLVFDFNSSGFDTGDVFLSYRLCLVNKWRYIDGYVSKRSRKPVWTYRGAPAFKRELWAVNMNEIGQKK